MGTERKTPLQALIEARALIEDFDRWTWGTFALTADGVKIGAADPLACRWCALGASLKGASITSVLYGRVSRYLCSAALEMFDVPAAVVDPPPVWVNDESAPDPAVRHANVLRIYDAAIADAREEESAQ